jgi:hypothetical protein
LETKEHNTEMTKKDRIEKQRLKVEQQIYLWEQVNPGTPALKEWDKLMGPS